MYSIWLLPSEKDSKRFQKIIETLSQSFKTPTFEPHLTLCTNIPNITDDLFYQISVLAALTSTFEVYIGEAQTSPHYFKSLFVQVHANRTLQNLQQEIQNLFSDIEYDFFPHLSLLYGELKEEVKKSKINLVKEDLVAVFQASQIAIVDTEGEVANWKIVEIFNLHQEENLHLDFVFDTVKNLKV